MELRLGTTVENGHNSGNVKCLLDDKYGSVANTGCVSNLETGTSSVQWVQLSAEQLVVTAAVGFQVCLGQLGGISARRVSSRGDNTLHSGQPLSTMSIAQFKDDATLNHSLVSTRYANMSLLLHINTD